MWVIAFVLTVLFVISVSSVFVSIIVRMGFFKGLTILESVCENWPLNEHVIGIPQSVEFVLMLVYYHMGNRAFMGI